MLKALHNLRHMESGIITLAEQLKAGTGKRILMRFSVGSGDEGRAMRVQESASMRKRRWT
jgi:hypothetical protein